MARKRVFLYVQHLLGIGHLKRAATLARALDAAGLEVTIASGGFAVPVLMPTGVRTIQLPPTAALDLRFRVLVDETGKPIDDAWKHRRREALLKAWRAVDPHALLIELFPFGRRQMRFELLPLLEAARSAARPPVIVSSVRDVLGGGQHNPARQDGMLALFEQNFDHLLVHGDPRFISFDRSFRHAARIADRLHYTGYVVETPLSSRDDSSSGAGEVVVSAGGGAVGQTLLETAVRARLFTSLAHRTWRLLAGINAGAAQYDSLVALAARSGGGRVIVERVRADFTQLLANCLISVSQAGYNTIMETLQAGARAVAVPWAGGTETEQTLRARLLAERGLIELVEEDALTAHTLAAAIDRAARRPRGSGQSIDLGGAQRSAALVAQWTSGLDR
ncbi:MAG: glycosyl transferase family 28 [Betaproteobacteria bacterium]|nr:glycosyl transferase family 28 [Betaproteobacteria bacterium]